MNTRIDLEDKINTVWQTSEDINLLFKHYLDAPVVMAPDDVANALLGIKVLHDMRCAALMDTYCRVFELDQYCTDPVKLAARENLFKPKKKKGSKND